MLFVSDMETSTVIYPVTDDNDGVLQFAVNVNLQLQHLQILGNQMHLLTVEISIISQDHLFDIIMTHVMVLLH